MSRSRVHPRPVWPVALFTGAYLLAACVAATRRGNLEFLMYAGVIVLLAPLIWALHRRVNLSSGALWGLSLWGLGHMLGGLVILPEGWPVRGDSHVLYTLWIVPGRLKFDHLIHAYGFGMTTWVCWQALRAALEKRGADSRPSFGLLLLCWAAGMGFGALNEIIEFAAALALPETAVGGYINTGWDLVANLVGSLVAVSLIALGARGTGRRRSGDGRRS
jgi:uncharacterized membrane protein YjdF